MFSDLPTISEETFLDIIAGIEPEPTEEPPAVFINVRPKNHPF